MYTIARGLQGVKCELQGKARCGGGEENHLLPRFFHTTTRPLATLLPHTFSSTSSSWPVTLTLTRSHTLLCCDAALLHSHTLVHPTP